MIFSDEFVTHLIKDIEEKSRSKCKECWCSTRDVLQARIDSYAMETEKYLGAAVIGEIGNNTFDHIGKHCRKKWSMYYQSGIGCCIVDKGNVIFTTGNLKVVGCLAILAFEGGTNEA